MSVECYRESPGKFDSRTLNRKTHNRWTGRTTYCDDVPRRRPAAARISIFFNDQKQLMNIDMLKSGLCVPSQH